MALSIRSLQFLGEYPKSKSDWNHPVSQILSAGAMALLKKYNQTQKSVDWSRWEWREIESFMRDSNLISAWTEEEVEAFDLPGEWKKIRSWVRWNHFFDQFSATEFQFTAIQKGHFRREIELLRQFHDYFKLCSSYAQDESLLKLADVNGDEIGLEIAPILNEDHEFLIPLIVKDIQKRGGECFKVVAY